MSHHDSHLVPENDARLSKRWALLSRQKGLPRENGGERHGQWSGRQVSLRLVPQRRMVRGIDNLRRGDLTTVPGLKVAQFGRLNAKMRQLTVVGGGFGSCVPSDWLSRPRRMKRALKRALHELVSGQW